MLRREDGHILRSTLHFEVEGQRKRGRLKRTWQYQFEEEGMKVRLRRENELCRSKFIVGVCQIATWLGEFGHPHLVILLDFRHWIHSSPLFYTNEG